MVPLEQEPAASRLVALTSGSGSRVVVRALGREIEDKW
jgi:hypothetical protein